MVQSSLSIVLFDVYIINVLSPTWSCSCKHFVAKLGTAGIFLKETKKEKETESENDNER